VNLLDSSHRRRASSGTEQLHRVFSFAMPTAHTRQEHAHAQAHIVVDLTAGLGTDGFVLAAGGVPVVLCERQPVLFHLLADAVRRLRHTSPNSQQPGSAHAHAPAPASAAPAAPAALAAVGRRMSVLLLDATSGPTAVEQLLHHAHAHAHAQALAAPHAGPDSHTQKQQQQQQQRQQQEEHGQRRSVVSVYLDPMYPAGSVGRRSAVKKGAQMLRRLADSGSAQQRQANESALLRTALEIVRRNTSDNNSNNSSSNSSGSGSASGRKGGGRVVVKRPVGAPPLAGVPPSSSRSRSRTHRYDIYMPAEVRWEGAGE